MREETTLKIIGLKVRTMKNLPKDTIIVAQKGAIEVDVTARNDGILVKSQWNPQKIGIIKTGEVE